ncbi:GmrSD restriction endonuclease domain-containing protein [Usitatibacter palustris]|uniref:GmrSD restriction endonucleases N-terminal domain-containing protein n=1 Tax=Usitatibacter palustris TaxID=2732487 RepID=A0A6M4H5T6_9PROT|nr:DUF262 domain-containing protein [Usitatibacter palustris]QJR14662.1 hypothetical protein DSM104440_01472 [Usitatibacter palustris]
MATQRYSVAPHPIETLLTWVKSGEIAIPEIQRPFVWEATKVRNLLDSLYQGYPIGYLISWRNPTVKLKDGTPSAGKRILIDGQQRVTALMAAILGREVLTKDYETVRIRIAFNPLEEKFDVATPIIRKDVKWIEDVSTLFAPDAKLLQITRAYAAANKGVDEEMVFGILERLRKIINNHVGIIELAEDLDIETVTEIFIRVNSAGAELSQADFAMSKIAANETYGGNLLRKAIDYFCHLSKAPEFYKKIEKGDRAFAASEFLPAMKWLKDINDDIYDPTYTDMLRVAFTSEFGRGKLQDLVALLSGRNFETKQYEEVIAEQSFGRLKKGILAFINKTHFDRITMILRSGGFVIADLISAQNNVNFAYILYLKGRAEKLPAADLEQVVRRWYAMSLLTRRYSRGNPETDIDYDIRQIDALGIGSYCEAILKAELSENFWSNLVPIELDTSSVNNAFFLAYQAAQVKAGDRGFLSRDITVNDLLLNRTDVHHVYPKDHLKGQGFSRGKYNQIANFVLAQSEINIAIGKKAPEKYFEELADQVNGGKKKHGGITKKAELIENLRQHCIPPSFLDGDVPEYDDFLIQRRQLMAAKVREWCESL